MEDVEYKLDIIVIAHNHLELTMKCVERLYACTPTPFHLIVVDDSVDLTPLYMADLKQKNPNITYIHSDEPYKSGNQIFNIGIKHSVTPYMATVMNSMTVEPEWEIEALRLMESNSKIGIVGFKCLYPETGLIESAGIRMIKWLPCDIGRDLPSHRLTSIYQVEACQWAFALLRKEAVEGNLDEDLFNGFKGVDDIDNCFVVKDKGWEIWYCGYGIGYHAPKATRMDNTLDGKELNAENMTTFYKRWGFYDDFKKSVENVQEIDLMHTVPGLREGEAV
ncbi:hypothetical protein LCGC14_1659830 [marine sediment metagenome]|uniref:Glycosyltransferase 2-like domain-containing protein n=1 Tax=marine sediment metagenome TaxID=412755 RepID=A0A0F9HUG4_9ZZZZ